MKIKPILLLLIFIMTPIEATAFMKRVNSVHGHTQKNVNTILKMRQLGKHKTKTTNSKIIVKTKPRRRRRGFNQKKVK